MARVTAEQATSKWVSRMSNASTQIQDGVARVTVAPGTKAAAASALWLQRVTAAQDKWKSRVGSVSLPDWQAAMNAGIPRVAAGAQAKQGKVLSFMQAFLPYVDQGVAAVRAMPKGDINASIARAAAMITHNSKFKR